MILHKIKKILTIIRCPEFWLPLCKGTAAGTEHLSILLNKKFNFVVDIGANKGQFTLISKKLFPNAIIHSFEPLDVPVKIFNNIFGNDERIFMHHCAIGSKKEHSKMYVSKKEDSSSLLPISKLQDTIFPGTGEAETVIVDVAPLNFFINSEDIISPALLKIDVQGFELEALKGCEPLLYSFDLIYCECSFVELYSGQQMAYDIIYWLHQRNFVLQGVYNTSYDNKGVSIQADFMFSRNNGEYTDYI